MPVALVPDGLSDQRADLGAARLFGVSRSRIEQAALAGLLKLDGVPVTKSARLSSGALLEVDLETPPPVQINPALVEGMGIVYQDADIVVVDKPAGIAAHPSLGWQGRSVLEHLAAAGIEVSTSGPAERRGIVSRLDVGTSGLMVVARSEMAYTALKRAFSERVVSKTYHCLVQGYPDPLQGTIDAPIGHAKTEEWKMAIDAKGRGAISHYQVLEVVKKAALVAVQLETGRTHQIRVHMAAIHHPCVGDLLYGADPVLSATLKLTRQWLHAVELGLEHPRSAQPLLFTSPYPSDLARSLEALRG